MHVVINFKENWNWTVQFSDLNKKFFFTHVELIVFIAECVHVEELLFLLLLRFILNKKWQSPTITKSALDYFSIEILVMAGTCF